jgi:translation initiation factor 1
MNQKEKERMQLLSNERKINTMSKDEIVYSFTLGEDPKKFEDSKNKIQDDGFIRLRLEKNKRGGKTVTVIFGFKLETDINRICSELKKKCGSGGTVKEGIIEIQGDKRDIIEKYLIDNGYKTKRAGG